MTLFSHPGVPLIRHMRQVAEIGQKTLQLRRISFDLPEGLVSDIAYLAGVTHDVAKGTRFFQHYLLSPTHEVIGPKDHALLSSLLTKNVVEQYLTRFELADRDRQLLPYLVYTAVKRHHGNLDDFSAELYLEKYSDKLVEQIENCDDEAIQTILDELLSPMAVHYKWEDFKIYIRERQFEDEYAGVEFALFTLGSYSDLPFAQKNDYFYLHQLFYSTLLLSDKSDVILKGLSIPNKQSATRQAIESYRIRKGFDRPRTELDRLKNKAYSIPKSFVLPEIFHILMVYRQVRAADMEYLLRRLIHLM